MKLAGMKGKLGVKDRILILYLINTRQSVALQSRYQELILSHVEQNTTVKPPISPPDLHKVL